MPFSHFGTTAIWTLGQSLLTKQGVGMLWLGTQPEHSYDMHQIYTSKRGTHLASSLLNTQKYWVPCWFELILYDFCFANWNFDVTLRNLRDYQKRVLRCVQIISTNAIKLANLKTENKQRR